MNNIIIFLPPKKCVPIKFIFCLQEENEWEDCEFIEVEEPLEPVELVDSWTQVCEEDLAAFAMSFQQNRRILDPVKEEVEPNTVSIDVSIDRKLIDIVF